MTTKLQKKIDAEAAREIPVVDERAPDQDGAIEVAFVEGTLPDEDRREPVEAAVEPVAAAVPDSLHALDSAPVNSKIVVVEGDGAILATPDFHTRLPDGDPAHKLPVGARIVKRAEGIYQSIQLSPAEDHPLLVTASARDAIAQFVPHFHES